jgi:hypothetical protein
MFEVSKMSSAAGRKLNEINAKLEHVPKGPRDAIHRRLVFQHCEHFFRVVRNALRTTQNVRILFTNKCTLY